MSPPGETRPMSFEDRDSNPENLQPESGAPVAAREWPGVSRESSPVKVQFPGEDGGKSLARMAEKDLDAALQLLAERAQYITGATGAAIALRDGEEMVCRASAGGSAPEIGARLQMDSGLSGESIRTRRMLRCDDALTDERVNRESCEALGIASVVVMPMLDGGEVIGVFELFSDQARAFEERDITALERMGAMVRTAVEQVEETDGAEEGRTGIAIEGPEPRAPMPAPQLADAADAEPGEDEILEEVLSETVAPAVDAVKKVPEETAKVGPHDDSLLAAAPASAEIARKTPAAEPEVGEMARDAAARTAAWKASQFEQDTPAAKASEPGPDRIAFHMRLPKKPGLTAAKAEADAPVADPSATDGSERTQWETPQAASVAGVVPASRADRQVATPEPAANGSLRMEAARGSVGAAAAPARAQEAETIKLAGAKLAEKTAEAAPANVGAAPVGVTAAIPATTKPAIQDGAVIKDVLPSTTADVQTVKTEVARPASAEGRSRIAVSQVRKCEGCGFPVSEGRKYCLDCEKKQGRGAGAGSPKKETTERAAPILAKKESVVEEQSAAEGSVVPKQVSTGPSPASVIHTPATVPEHTEGKNAEGKAPEAKQPEGMAVAGPNIVEPPAPQFMVSSPDHYESWIVSHMYSAVAIAVVVVGIVVYLLSR
jgi:putative methionine-R-sulfoxide reductase with GAF domain